MLGQSRDTDDDDGPVNVTSPVLVATPKRKPHPGSYMHIRLLYVEIPNGMTSKTVDSKTDNEIHLNYQNETFSVKDNFSTLFQFNLDDIMIFKVL